MPALVEGERYVRKSEQQQAQARSLDHVREPSADSVEAEEPDVEGQQAPQRREHHRRQEQRAEHASDPVHNPWRQDAHPVAQPEQRLLPLEPRGGAVGPRHHSQRVQLLLEHVANLIGSDSQLQLVAGPAADRRQITGGRPGVLGDDVEQPGHLHHLPVRAADEIRRLAQTGALGLAE